MSLFLRICLVLIFVSLGVVCLVYAVSAAPKSVRGETQPIAFKWTAADADCFEAYEQCNTEVLVARATSAPLSARPYALQLVNEIITGNQKDADDLASAVLLRDPRSRDARQVLAASALGRGDIEAFLRSFLPLFDVDRVQGPAYAEFLAGISTHSGLRDALMPHLAQSPAWATAYLNALARRGGLSLSELIPLYRMVPRAQPALLRRLTQEGKWDAAYIAFADFVAGPVEGPRLKLSAPFNPEFVKSTAPAPFNWTLNSRGGQFLEEGGIYIFYEGRKAETLLVQTFPLAPGQWQLVSRQSGGTSAGGGSFKWSLSCAGSSSALAQFEVSGLKEVPGEETWPFEVTSSSCPYAVLSLRGVPGAFPQPARIELKSVRLSRQDGAGETR
jgi:hypothetical protein